MWHQQINMRTLGIDYGKAKIGLAIADGGLSEPLQVIRYKDIKILSEQIKQIVEKERIDKIVVGISEGVMAEETKKFVSSIHLLIYLPIDLFDETLSTQDAQRLSQESGMNRKKRHDMEDAFAASVMLQSYLDTNV